LKAGAYIYGIAKCQCNWLVEIVLVATIDLRMLFLQVFWKLDPMENSLRMRLRLKQSYKGTDHHGAAADYKEPEISSMSQALGSTPLPEGAPKLAPEEESLEESVESIDEELTEKSQEREEGSEEMNKEAAEAVVEGSGSSVSVPTQATNATVAAVAAAMSAELKEILILEIPAAMVLPLKTLRGRFQVRVFLFYCCFALLVFNQIRPIGLACTGSDFHHCGESFGQLMPLHFSRSQRRESAL